MVELLTVIDIIGILVGLLVPALSHAKSEAQAIQCLSNARQFALAWTMYAYDHDDYLPPNEGSSIGAPPSDSWVNGILNPATDDWPDNTNTLYLSQSLLAPYLGTSLGVWRCPSDKSMARAGGTLFPRTRTYSMSRSADDFISSPPPVEKLRGVRHPSEEVRISR